MYVPAEPAKESKPKRGLFKKKPEAVAAEPVGEHELDLAENIKRRQRMIRRLFIFGSLFAAAFVAIGLGLVLYFRTPESTPPVAINQPPVNTPVVNIPPANVPVNNAPIPPTNEVIAPGQPLPDTPLAPLRGALIKFANSSDIYLIENNGELRLIDQINTIFKNGQRVSDLNPNLIYQLPDKWQTVRKGDKIVTGQVDFDPRVLSLNELLPYIQ